MAKWKLVAGQHVQRNADGTPSTYNRGDIIESDDDLEALHGPGRFVKVGGEGGEFGEDGEHGEVMRHNTGHPVRHNAAPGGQVSEGIQQTSGDTSGALSHAEAEKQQRELAKKQQKENDDPTELLTQDQLRQKMADSRRAPDMELPEGETDDARKAAPKTPVGPASTAPAEQKDKDAPATQAKRHAPDMGRMSMEDLRRHADENKIDVRAAKSRNEVMEAIRKHYK